MGQGHGVASIRIPKLRENANVTLKYCDNPVWGMRPALPSILNPESVNILSVVKSLYANSTAVDIVKKYPAVKRESNMLWLRWRPATARLLNQIPKKMKS